MLGQSPLWDLTLTKRRTLAIVARMHRPAPLPKRRAAGRWLYWITLAAALAGCASDRRAAPSDVDPAQTRRLIERSLPDGVTDREGWTADLYAGFAILGIEPGRQNVCAVIAVIEQESGFRVDPVIPGLPAIAWKEIDERAARAGIPRLVLHGVLQLTSPTGRSYSARIDGARTEKELSDIYEDFIGSVPLGRTLFADHNPIRTRGPMQVNVVFAEQFAAARPYPYPVKTTIADEVFTRHGGIYFGIAHLLAYPAGSDNYIYRFADFNAGQYASRNAAFQQAITIASGIPLTADGALLPHDGDGSGATEAALRALGPRLSLSDSSIHAALVQAKTQNFERTPVYLRVFARAEQAAHRSLARAAIPRIELHGPKITRKLTTEWYAQRVNGRFEGCLRQ